MRRMILLKARTNDVAQISRTAPSKVVNPALALMLPKNNKI